ncbi:unnamed protein product [Cyprideis torosa]|uniref:Uncharacterized protein n=1 Tax=Cyprideis torosa TaxID=163714 RepID=A0A7R8X2D0_9CRUS|nr:unnamed protein product [Cyprideis torosa]CAG0910805.1 unnamed protein product [Cyprideis torosa]
MKWRNFRNSVQNMIFKKKNNCRWDERDPLLWKTLFEKETSGSENWKPS